MPPTCRQGSSRALSSGTTSSPGHASSSAGEDQFDLALDPETARAYHDETLPQEGAKAAQVLLDVRTESSAR